MASITTCDKCGKQIKTGFDHHATLKLMNPIKEIPDKGVGYVHEGGQADLCGKCLIDVMEFGGFRNKEEIKEARKTWDLDF